MWVPVSHAESLLLENGRQRPICKVLIDAAIRQPVSGLREGVCFTKSPPYLGRMLWKVHLAVTPTREL